MDYYADYTKKIITNYFNNCSKKRKNVNLINNGVDGKFVRFQRMIKKISYNP